MQAPCVWQAAPGTPAGLQIKEACNTVILVILSKAIQYTLAPIHDSSSSHMWHHNRGAARARAHTCHVLGGVPKAFCTVGAALADFLVVLFVKLISLL